MLTYISAYMNLKGKGIDIILIIFAVFFIFTTDWKHITSFHQVMILLYALCVMLRMINMIRLRRK